MGSNTGACADAPAAHPDGDTIARLCHTIRPARPGERAAQDAIEAALIADGVPYTREARLSRTDRIDFLTATGVGIEVKVDCPVADVLRQLARYARHDQIAALVVVATNPRSVHRLPATIGGVPVTAIVPTMRVM